MLDLGIERIGDLGIVECAGRIVRSESAFKLRRAVNSLDDCGVIVIDLSEVSAVEGGGLGMLVFLQQWANDHQIQLKLFNPRKSVFDRLQMAGPMRSFDIISLPEMMQLLSGADQDLASAA